MGDSNEKTDGPVAGPITCPGHSRPVPDLCYGIKSDGCAYLLSSCLDGKPMLRDAHTGDWIGTFIGHKGAIWCSRFNRDASRAATAAADFTVKLWNTDNGNEMHTFEHKHIVKAVEFSPDSRTFFSGGHEKKLRMFDVEKYDADPHIMDLGWRITQISVCKHNPNYVICSSDEQNVISIWDQRILQHVRNLTLEDKVSSLQVHGDEYTMVSTAGSQVQFWNTETFDLIRSFDLTPAGSKHAHRLYCAALHPKRGRKMFVSGSLDDLWARVWNYDSGVEVGTQRGHHGPVRCIAFAPDGQSYATGSEDGTIRIWDVDAPCSQPGAA
eukprot:35816_1